VEAEGTYTFGGGPGFRWDLFHVTPEVRVAWDLEIFRPYVGLAYGMSFGSVTGTTKFQAEATIDRVAGEAVDMEPVLYRDSLFEFTATPPLNSLRAFVGFDIALSFFAISIQADLSAVAGEAGFDALPEAAGAFVPDTGDPLANTSLGDSAIAATFVLTTALRFEF
jgi:hypothetical protein